MHIIIIVVYKRVFDVVTVVFMVIVIDTTTVICMINAIKMYTVLLGYWYIICDDSLCKLYCRYKPMAEVGK